MTDQDLVAQLSLNHVRFVDEHIRTRLSEVLGSSDWAPEDLVGRLTIAQTTDKMEWFQLDGAAFLKAAPADVQFEGGHVRMTRQFWIVRHPLEADEHG